MRILLIIMLVSLGGLVPLLTGDVMAESLPPENAIFPMGLRIEGLLRRSGRSRPGLSFALPGPIPLITWSILSPVTVPGP